MGIKSSSKRVEFTTTYSSLPWTGTPVASRSRQIVVLTRAHTGADNPKWRQRIEDGLSATNSFIAHKYELAYTKGSMTVMHVKVGYPNYGKTIQNTFLGVVIALPARGLNSTTVALAKNRAAIGIRMKIKSETQNFSGPTFLGEIHKTVQSIRSPVKALRKTLNDYISQSKAAKRRIKSGKDWSNALADSWLEWSFGAKPLMNDITAIAESALAKVEEKRIKRISYTGQAENATTTYSNINIGGVSINVDYSRSNIESVSSRIVVGYQVEAIDSPRNALMRVVDLGGFNLTELIPTAWELLPWSFFIDYFSNIGDVLSASLVSLENVAWTRQTTRGVKKIRYDGQDNFKLLDTIVIPTHFTPARYESKLTEIERSAAPVAIPSLRFELPGSNSQFLNIAALTRSVRL